jgi:hypothetical protein
VGPLIRVKNEVKILSLILEVKDEEWIYTILAFCVLLAKEVPKNEENSTRIL